MLRVTVLCVGRCKERYYKEAAEEYARRLGAFCKLEVVEVAEERCPDDPSPAQIAAALQKEGDRLLQKCPERAAAVAMCVEGRPLSSPELADYLSAQAAAGVSRLVFFIGGSNGLSPAVKERAGERFSVSPMTFPHTLFRVMLLEQLYRGFQIASGGKYHK